jgi:hypothetical protein
MDPHAVGAGIDPAAERELDAAVQALGIRLRGLREDDRETALADMACDVGRANGGADPLACGDEVGASPLLQVEDEEP